MSKSYFPSLYQINTRVKLTELSAQLGRRASLDDISEPELDELASLGFDWIYLLGIWQTGIAGRNVSRSHPEWRREYQALLRDLQEEDICGSCFAIANYTVNQRLGDNQALKRLRERLHQRQLKLMLDFVPNHTAIDHPWVNENPGFYIQGTQADLQREPQNYLPIESTQGPQIFAYGRDPYFSGWPDTLQLNYGNPAVQEAMLEELLRIALMCDGVRCDMAMLILPQIFERTWNIVCEPFWLEAIGKIKEKYPSFVFMAEVYWDKEWSLQQQGFDYTYDKRLYDRLRESKARSVREHFWADLEYQRKSVRFLENHDEPRAAAIFSADIHQAAAILTYCCPGLRFFHQGQLQGWSQKISIHLCRGPEQQNNQNLEMFYRQLLDCLHLQIVRQGSWQLLECTPAWEENRSWNNYIAFAWEGEGERRLLITVNYAPSESQCYVRLPFPELKEQMFRLEDLMSTASYERWGNSLLSPGLYLDLPAWGYHIFDLIKQENS